MSTSGPRIELTAAAVKGSPAPFTTNPKMAVRATPVRQGSTSSASDEQSARSSFSSVRENESGLPQNFTSTKISSYSKPEEEAIDDQQASSSVTMSTTTTTAATTHFMPPLTQPASRLHGCWFPAVAADGFKGWKQIDVKGRLASRSFGDLQSLRVVWSPPATEPPSPWSPGRPGPGDSHIERLPLELLESIIRLLVLDVPTNGLTARNVDLMSLLLTSRKMHEATIDTLYRHITIPHSRIFKKFLTHISANQELGTIVRRLDFSHFNPMTLFTTASERATTRNLTAETLLQCLDLVPFLRDFLGQEYIEDEINEDVIRKLLFDMPRLKALDFCACTSPVFRNGFEALLQAEWPASLSLSRLSLHRCDRLSPEVFEKLLPRLDKLTHLDLAGTRVTDEALLSIPRSARITHLNLAKCSRLNAPAVLEFITHHPAAKSLVFLSLGTDARSHQLLDEEDLEKLLPALPATLRSLSLRGSKMNESHIDLLRPLTKHLEELALGRRLNLNDIDRLFVPDEGEGEDISQDQLEWVPHTLKFLDLSDYHPSQLELGALFGRQNSILKKHSAPLEVIEVADEVFKRISKLPAVRQAGWASMEFENRAWLVRNYEPAADGGGTPRDSGHRDWKLGASFWGMRKIPVAAAEVGGMYGSYMFKRKL